MKSEKEAELTLTPSGFLFSRLLAAVEKKIMQGNQWPAGISACACTHTHTLSHNAQCIFKAGQLLATSKWALLELEAEEKNAH